MFCCWLHSSVLRSMMSGEYCHYITCAQPSADCWAELATHNVVLSESFCNACGQINPDFTFLRFINVQYGYSRSGTVTNCNIENNQYKHSLLSTQINTRYHLLKILNSTITVLCSSCNAFDPRLDIRSNFCEEVWVCPISVAKTCQSNNRIPMASTKYVDVQSTLLSDQI